jgi:hypothetical protein
MTVEFRTLNLVVVGRLLSQSREDLARPLGISELGTQCRTQGHP